MSWLPWLAGALAVAVAWLGVVAIVLRRVLAAPFDDLEAQDVAQRQVELSE